MDYKSSSSSLLNPISNALDSLFGGKKRAAASRAGEVASISFEDFVRFVVHEVDSGQRSYGSLHWLPATELCQPCLQMANARSR